MEFTKEEEEFMQQTLWNAYLKMRDLPEISTSLMFTMLHEHLEGIEMRSEMRSYCYLMFGILVPKMFEAFANL